MRKFDDQFILFFGQAPLKPVEEYISAINNQNSSIMLSRLNDLPDNQKKEIVSESVNTVLLSLSDSKYFNDLPPGQRLDTVAALLQMKQACLE